MNTEIMKSNEIAFLVMTSNLQCEVKEKIGRRLVDDEIETAKKDLEYGFLATADAVYNTIPIEMINT
jgi:hypothetical protein